MATQAPIDVGVLPPLSHLTARDVHKLRQAYAMPDEAVVLAFVDQYPHLLTLLDEVREQASTAFGTQVTLSLDVATDPDEGDRALFARIHTDLPPSEALGRLDQLWDQWWSDALPQANGLLHVDVRCG